MVVGGWVRDLILFLVGCVIAFLGGALLPYPFSTVAYVIGGLIALVALILLLVHLLGGAAGGPHGPHGPV